MRESKTERAARSGELVVCDWGSSKLRAYLVGGDGTVRRRYESEKGAKSLAGASGAYREELNSVLRTLQVDNASEIGISGMAGSKMGWRETAYHPTPVGTADLAAGALSLEDSPGARLYGGVSHDAGDGLPEVMRGEEVQVFGALQLFPGATDFCLPGTHSKWVRVEGDKIISFRTFLTGDLFQALAENTIFSEQIGSREFHPEGFSYGCQLATEGIGLEDLFKLRRAFVFSRVSREDFHSALSGFLITAEVLAAGSPPTGIHLCGASELISRYALALKHLGIEGLVIDAEAATIRGHLALRQP